MTLNYIDLCGVCITAECTTVYFSVLQLSSVLQCTSTLN